MASQIINLKLKRKIRYRRIFIAISIVTFLIIIILWKINKKVDDLSNIKSIATYHADALLNLVKSPMAKDLIGEVITVQGKIININDSKTNTSIELASSDDLSSIVLALDSRYKPKLELHEQITCKGILTALNNDELGLGNTVELKNVIIIQ